MFLLVFVCVLGVSFGGVAGARVDTPYGHIDGAQLTSRNGRLYNYFTNIPYAKPPIGPLRFKSPVPAEPWSEVLNGTNPVPKMCMQRPFYIPATRGNIIGEEDCLYLNIFSPNIDPDARLPVLVYIHGGGWREGFPGSAMYYKNFMDKDVVLVGISYRLGILGFLSTEDLVIPGNFGMKDQSLALKWIRENIQHFGGDPKSVTIFGESAGAASVHLHMMSPLSKGLVDRFISQSGNAHAVWANAPPGLPLKNALKLAQCASCPQSPTEELLKCLQGMDAHQLVDLEKNFVVWDINPVAAFLPVVEKRWEGAFMTQPPHKLKTHQPWIIGFTKDEGRIMTSGLINQPESVTEDFVRNMDSYIPYVGMFFDKTSKEKEITEIFKKEFFSQTDRTSILNGLRKMFTDVYFVPPSMSALANHEGDAYFYFLDYLGEFSLADISGPKVDENPGASHADELVYLFSWDGLFPHKTTKEDEDFSKLLVTLWTNFGKTGRPTSESDSINWEVRKRGDEFLHMKGPDDTARGSACIWENWTKINNFWKKVPIWEYLDRFNKDEL